MKFVYKLCALTFAIVASLMIFSGCDTGENPSEETPPPPEKRVLMLWDFETEFDDPYILGEEYITYISYGMYDPWGYKLRTQPFEYGVRMQEDNGNHVFKLKTSNGWDGVCWAYPGYNLPFSTNTFKVKVKGNNIEDIFRVNVMYNSNTGQRFSEDITVTNFETLEDGWFDATFTISGTANTVVTVNFKTFPNLVYYVDDIRAIEP